MIEASAFDAAEKQGGVQCKVCAFLTGRADRDVYTREMVKPAAIRSHGAITRVLNSQGCDVSESGVKRHRRAHVS